MPNHGQVKFIADIMADTEKYNATGDGDAAQTKDALLDRSDLTPRTPHSLTEPEAIMTELARIRAQGYAIIDQEVEIGLRSIAVPILNVQDRTVAAMNVGLPALHADASALAEIYLPGLKRTQAGLRRVLH